MDKSPRQIGADSEEHWLLPPDGAAQFAGLPTTEPAPPNKVESFSIEEHGVARFFRMLLGFLQDRDTYARWPGDPGFMDALILWNLGRLAVRDWIEDHHPNPNVATRVLSDLDKRFLAFFEAIKKRDPPNLSAGSDWDWETDPAWRPGWNLIGCLGREMQRFERLGERGAVAHPMPTQHGEPPKDATDGGKADRSIWLARAMLFVRDHPECSDRRIAARVGVSPSALHRSPIYQAAAALAREPKKVPDSPS